LFDVHLYSKEEERNGEDVHGFFGKKKCRSGARGIGKDLEK
jgi:hypothetical protein